MADPQAAAAEQAEHVGQPPPLPADIATPTDEQQAIIRQVEYYFSDENLPNDAYMLGLTGGASNNPVSISRISGFARMRKYKPLSKVKEAIKLSTFLEYTDSKHIRRREPLAVEPNVEPVYSENRPTAAVQPGQSLVDPSRPWISKAMLKPTGFEEYFADGPIRPEEHMQDKQLYDDTRLFEERIEYAIQRYTSRRKFHTDMRQVFDAFMTYGGIEMKPKQFTGNHDNLDDMDASEIAAAKAIHFVAGHVEKEGSKWVVDFAGVALAFLSSSTVLDTTSDPAASAKFISILSNFYRYLLHHDVCPEYDGQLKDALEVCRIASTELEAAIRASFTIPDRLGKALSVVSGGLFSQLEGLSHDYDGEGNPSGSVLSRDSAMSDVCVAFERMGIFGHDTNPSVASGISIISERDAQLQIMAIESPAEPSNETTTAFMLGKMACRELNESFDAPLHDSPELITFWTEANTLNHCFTGMKLDVTICENTLGNRWIERIRSANPSYFQVIANDFWEKEDEAILPKEWYKRERAIKEQGYRKVGDPSVVEEQPVEGHENTIDAA